MKKTKVLRVLPLLAGMFSPAAFADCPSVTLQIPFTVLGAAAGSGTVQDSAGNTWSFTYPVIPPSQQVTSSMTFTPPSTWSCGGTNALAAGAYVFTSNGMSLDGGCNPVGDYPTNSGFGQQWVWNGSTLRNQTQFLVDAGGNPDVAGLSATGDNWTIVQSGNGYTIKNNRTGNYLGTNATACYPPSHPLSMWVIPVVWTIN